MKESVMKHSSIISGLAGSVEETTGASALGAASAAGAAVSAGRAGVGNAIPRNFGASSLARTIGFASMNEISAPMLSANVWPGTRNFRLTAQT